MTKVSNMDNALSWMEKVLKFIKEYGMWNIIKAGIVIVFMSLCIRVCYDPTIFFEKYHEWYNSKHAIELEARADMDSKVKQLLPMYLYKYHANRVFIIQYHNGVKDWQHGTMRFEQCSDQTPSIREHYTDFNLTWLNMPFYLKDKEYFIGTIKELGKVDPVLAGQLKGHDTEFLACILMRNSEGLPQGIYGITWPKTPIDIHTMDEKIKQYLHSDVSEIKPLLDDIKVE